MEMQETLELAGFSKIEAKSYLDLLSLGQVKASQLAIKSKMNRGAVYYALQILKEKGFVSEVIKSGVRHYSAAPPEKLIELVEEQQQKKIALLSESLSDLKSIKPFNSQAPLIEIYEGYEGFKTIFNVVLEHGEKELLCLMSPKIIKYLPHFHEQFRKRRIAKHIKIRTITNKSKELEAIRKSDKSELRETRFSKEELFTNSDVLLYIFIKGIITIRASSSRQIGVYIQDESIANFHKNIFETLWKNSE